MRKKSFQIALAAVSCALATLLVALLGINTSFAFTFGYMFGAIALMLPLSKKFWWGGAMAYLATCLLCLAFNGIPLFYKLFPFVAFFGLHPLVNALFDEHRVNRWISFIVKEIWFVGMLCGSWALFNAMTEVSLPYDWMYAWAYPVLVVAGAAIFLVYDWLMKRAQRLVDHYVSKIERGKGGATPPPSSAASGEEKKFDVFGELGEDSVKSQNEDGDSSEKRSSVQQGKKSQSEGGDSENESQNDGNERE